MEPLQYEQRGYLHENFRLFHLADDVHQEFAFHYHPFHKIIFLLAGRADYAIEGEHYHLQSGDCVLVGRGSIHRPEVAEGDFYERMILYISPAYLSTLPGGEDMTRCFRRAQSQFRYVFHASADDRIRELFGQLERAEVEGGFGSALLQEALFTQLMVAVNRCVLRGDSVDAHAGDTKVLDILHYLNTHLTEPLSIDELAGRFYLSKFHMMRRFRAETGYSIHSYVTEKRLLQAQQLLQSGATLSDTAERCGYRDYSTFSRAYKKRFGCAPSRRGEGD